MISKSAFIRGIQCQKALFLYKNYYNLRDKPSVEQLAKFKRGTQVGVYAQLLFPNGVDCSPKKAGDTKTWVKNTQLQISNENPILYEAAFEFNGSMAAMDIYTKIDGFCQAYEVKSSLKISPVFEIDLAFQTYIIKQSGHQLDGAGIITVNGDYQKNGEIDWQQYFQFSDYSDHLKLWHPWIEEQIAIAENTLSQGSIPKIGIGKQCFEPYSCDFIKFCWKKPLAEHWSNTIPFKTTHHHLFAEKGLVPNLKTEEINTPNEFFFMLFAAPAIPMLNGCKPYQKTPLAMLQVNILLQKHQIVWIIDEELDNESLLNQCKRTLQNIKSTVEVVDQITHQFIENNTIDLKFNLQASCEKVMEFQSEFRISVDNEINSLKTINNNYLTALIEEMMRKFIVKMHN